MEDQTRSIRSNVPRPKIRLSLLLPTLPQTLSLTALLVAWVLMTLGGLSLHAWRYPDALRYPMLDSLSYWLDPLFVQGSSVVFVAGVLTQYQAKTVHGKMTLLIRLLLFFKWTFLLFLCLVITLGLERSVFKPVFSLPRPLQASDPLGETWLTGAIGNMGESSDVPSGYAIRQITLFLFSLWVVSQPDFPPMGRLSARGAQLCVVSVSGLATVWVCFSRVYRLNHSLLAITVAVGVASMLFWTLLCAAYVVFGALKTWYKGLVSEIFLFYVPYALVFAYYSNEADEWLVVSLVFISLLFILRVIASRRLSQQVGG